MKDRFWKWIQTETDKKYMIYVLGLFAFVESIIFPLPIDIMTLGLAVANPKNWFKYWWVSTIFSVLGALCAYILGYYLFDSFGMQIIEFFHFEKYYEQVSVLLQENVFWVMFASAFTPIPYKVFTLTGGALGVALVPFTIASILGRGIRFFLETYLAFRFGEQATKHVLKKINIYSLLLVCIIIGYFIIRAL